MFHFVEKFPGWQMDDPANQTTNWIIAPRLYRLSHQQKPKWKAKRKVRVCGS